VCSAPSKISKNGSEAGKRHWNRVVSKVCFCFFWGATVINYAKSCKAKKRVWNDDPSIPSNLRVSVMKHTKLGKFKLIMFSEFCSAELFNISIFGSILFPVRSEMEWVPIFLENHVHGHKSRTLGDEHKN
jgi:hypothetical protein